MELEVFAYLRKHKVYFQRHYKKVAGNPDIALPSKKKAVFIDGDFWHGWQFNKVKARLPEAYWLPKIEANIKRDKKNRKKLCSEGWEVLRIWEHDLKRKKSKDKTLQKVFDFLRF